MQKLWIYLENLFVILIVYGSIDLIPNVLSRAISFFCLFFGYVLILNRGYLKVNGLNKNFYLYCGVTLLSLIFSPYLGISLFLSTCQFILFTVLMVNFDGAAYKYLLYKLMQHFTYLTYIGIIYSFLLKTFGSRMIYQGRTINYLFSPLLRQSIMGLGHDLGYSSLWTNPNTFGFYILLVFIWKLCTDTSLKVRSIAIKIALAFGCILTGSRAVYVCIFLAILVYAYYRMKNYAKVLSIFFIVIMCVAFVGIGVISVSEMISGVDFTGRLKMWKIMVDTVKKYPLFGVGFATTSKYLLRNEITGKAIGSHNAYLNILAEVGIVGTIVFIIILVKVVQSIIEVSKKSVENLTKLSDGMFLFAITSFWIFIPYSMVENTFMMVDAKSYFWIFICSYLYNCKSKAKSAI